MDIRKLEDENLYSLHILAGRILTGLWRKQNIVRLSYLNDKKPVIAGVKNLLALLKEEGLIEEFSCATKKEIDWDYLQKERGEDFEDDYIGNIDNNWLSTLPKEELVAMYGPSIQKEICEIHVRVFASNKFENFYQRVYKERHRRLGMDYAAPPHFDKESGKFAFNGKTIKLGRGNLQYKLVEFLYDNPNTIHSYRKIGYRCGILKKLMKKKQNLSARDLEILKLCEENIGLSKQRKIPEALHKVLDTPEATVVFKKRIIDYVSEIKKKLGLPEKDESLFFCNDGYMMIRNDKKNNDGE